MAEPPCPVCFRPAGKPPGASPDTRPFCSRRCADIDLARWFGGAYRLPSQREDEGGAEEPD